MRAGTRKDLIVGHPDEVTAVEATVADFIEVSGRVGAGVIWHFHTGVAQTTGVSLLAFMQFTEQCLFNTAL